ncbi:MAG: ClpXP protease specificity-enhancing factor SspB [Beijerinckiaceae bacterium]|nr:ClpXP protease specificity-enhancing factor SspB [Beijerinckiaceae bacterium]
MAVDLIRYDLLVQDALRNVIRDVLSAAARDGLPGEHHFYISFRTHARGVRLSNRMRDRYPDEMTIILQYQFWDLSVTEEAFEVGLSFQNIPEILLVPFDAVTRFADPAVGFELQFAVEDDPGRAAASKEPPPSKAAPARAKELSPQLPHPDGQEGTAVQRVNVSQAAPEETLAPEGEPKVVSIDAFRKKN